SDLVVGLGEHRAERGVSQGAPNQEPWPLINECGKFAEQAPGRSPVPAPFNHPQLARLRHPRHKLRGQQFATANPPLDEVRSE
ncbi:hypothetical protein CEJ63_24690, partial [Acinetobacter baumannii]